MSNLDKNIAKSAWNTAHYDGVFYSFNEQALIEFVKGFMLDAMHDSTIQKQLLEIN